MTRAEIPRPVEPVGSVVHGVTLWTTYDPIKQKHDFVCDLCGRKVDAGPYGRNTARIDKHRATPDCWLAQRAQAVLQGRPLPPLPPTAHTSTAPSRMCFGAPYKWPAGPLWVSYPFQRHDSGTVGWTPFAFDPPNNTIYFRSDDCEKTVSGPAVACRPCERVVNAPAFRAMEHLAGSTNSKRNLGYEKMTHKQATSALRQTSSKLRSVRVQLDGERRSKRRWMRRAREQDQLVLLLAKRDVPRLRWVLAAALKRGTSPSRLLSILIRAADGTYRAHGFSQRELDVSCLAAELGGPRLLYALGRSHGLLSKRTVGRHLHIPRLLASLAVPTRREIDMNLSAFLDLDVSPAPCRLEGAISDSLPGHILMVDGVAVDPRAGYCTRRNHAIGFSRETAGTVNTEVSSLETVEAMRTALYDKRLRFGSEATVVAVAPYVDKEHYTPTPLVVSPSDKSEDALGLQQWLQLCLDSWKEHQFGERLRGPIWSLASDGDATFRKAKHLMCAASAIDSQSELWPELSTLRGFNMRVSPDGQTTWTCDPKHIIKRFATLLRSPSGFMFFGTVIHPHDILSHLKTHGSLTDEDALQLLDPADKQNVPKAVALMQRLHELSVKSKEVPALTPYGDLRRIRINCFSDILCYFVEPFIDVNMSLSEQLKSLSAFSHAIAIIQVKHGSSCFTGALFADTQATIKNIYVIVARLRRINPKYCLYILLEGTDRLEQVFSETRTLDHARNFDTLQLSYKLSSAFLIHAIFQRNPDLDRGHRRSDMSNAMGIDHLNPASWVGDVCVENVDLDAMWAAGRELAVERLAADFGSTIHEVSAQLSRDFLTPSCDVCRPEGHYVGVSGLSDGDERSERVEPEVSPHIPRPVAETVPEAPDAGEDESDDDFPSTGHVLPSPAESPHEESEAIDGELGAADGLPDGIDFDDFFPDTITPEDEEPTPVLSHAPSVSEYGTFSRKLDDGKGGEIWKSSLVATLSADRSRSVTVRTLRAQGITLEDLRKKSKLQDFHDDSLEIDHLYKPGDLVAFLARVGGSYALALLEISEFRMADGARRLSVTQDEFDSYSRSSDTKVLGQVLHLQESADRADQWYWSTAYISSDGETDARFSHGRYIVDVPIAYVHPVTSTLIQLAQEPGENQTGTPPPLLTWSFSASQLKELVHDLWASLEPESDGVLMNLQSLPALRNTVQLPYRGQNDVPQFILRDLPAYLVPEPKHDADAKVSCYICGASHPLKKMREHVGHHILRSYRGIPDDSLPGETSVPESPCGWCGRATCVTVLHYQKNRAAPNIISSCGYHYTGMRYSSAMKSTAASPSSNVPIQCLLCAPSKSGHHPTVWKYNMATHLISEHNGGKHDPQIEASMFISMHITRKEEEAMLIPSDTTTSYRSTLTLPNSEDIGKYEQTLVEQAKGKTKTSTRRVRAETTESEKAARPPAQRLRGEE